MTRRTRLGAGVVASLAIMLLGVAALARAADISDSVPVAADVPLTTVAPTTTETTVPETTTTTEAPPPPPEPAPPVVAATAPAPEPAPAPAPPPPPPPTPAERGAEALTLIDYPWERLGYSLTFEGANPGLLGKTDCGTHQVFVYVRPTQTIRQVAFVTAFELAHAIDCGTMTNAKRAEWAGIRGFPEGWKWFAGCLCTEDNYGSGDISMVFANWLVPNGGYRWRSNLAGPPSPEQLQQLMPYLRPAQVG